MSSVMDGLETESYDRTYSDSELLRNLGGIFEGQTSKMGAVAVAVALVAASDAFLPIYVSRTLDDVVSGNVRLHRFGAVFISVSTLSWCLSYMRRALTAEVVGAAVLELRRRAVASLMSRDMSFYDEKSTGRITSRVNSDTGAIAEVIGLCTSLVGQMLTVTLLMTFLLSVHTGLAALVSGVIPLMALASLGFRRLARLRLGKARRVSGTVSAHLHETMAGLAVAKAFRQERAIWERFRGLNRHAFEVKRSAGYIFCLLFPMLATLAGIGTAVVALAAGAHVVAAEISIGDWYLFIQGTQLMWLPVTGIASFWSQFQAGLAAGERVLALCDASPTVVQRAQLKPPALQGAIELADVRFSYVPGVDVLKGVSLRALPGERIALVGHSGSGKSTILKLVARLYEHRTGRITVDGVDLRTVDLEQYRRQLGVLTQVPFLFSGTVAENIRYGRPDASDEDVAFAARQVAGGEWVSLLTAGIHTQVGHRGCRLSMGQRQLVALARVLLNQPAMLLLDEATASIDPVTESLLRKGLEAAMVNRTSLVVAHRLSTILSSDRIFVLNEGRVVEAGTHDELLRRDGQYQQLYRAYFRHQSLEYVEGAENRVSASSV